MDRAIALTMGNGWGTPHPPDRSSPEGREQPAPRPLLRLAHVAETCASGCSEARRKLRSVGKGLRRRAQIRL
jgi:hypothetical protein